MRISFHKAALAVAALFFHVSGAVASSDEISGIVLENPVMRLTLNPKGYAESLLDKMSGEECLDTASGPVPFCTLTQYRPYDNENFLMYPAKPKVFPADSIYMSEGCLKVEFDGTADIAVIDVNIRPDYIGFTLSRIDYRIEDIGVKRRTEIDEMAFVRIPVKQRRHFGEWLNTVWDDRSGVSLIGTTPETRVDTYSDRGGMTMWAGSEFQVGLTGVGAALVTASGERMLDSIASIEKDFGMPSGVASRRRPEYRYSYYELRDVTTENIDRHIEYAKKGGFRTIVIYYPDFAYTCGHFLWNSRYPGGLEDLKAITAKIKAAGIIPGFHIHYSKVSIDDPYFCSGVPDARLNYVEDVILSEGVGEDASVIPLDASPRCFHTEEGRRIVRIGDELVEYTSFTTERPYMLTGCRRGLYGTTAVSHPEGSRLLLLDVDTWPRFIRVDQNTSIQDEISENIGRLYKEAGFEFVYFDGAEDVPMPYWYNVSKSQLSVYERLDPEPLFSEGALKSHFGWHILTRGNAFDLFRPERIREAMKIYTLPCAARIADDFTSVNFGWVDYLAPDSTTVGMQPDMYEYICSKALAWDSPISLMGKLDQIGSHPRTDDNFDVIRRWEEAKISGVITEERKLMLRDPEREFTLLGDNELVEYRAVAATDKVRAFSFTRNGKACVMFWATGRPDTPEHLNMDATGLRLRLVYPDGRRAGLKIRNGKALLPLGGRMILESDTDEETLAGRLLAAIEE